MAKFQFLGFATFLITADDGTTILIDPYLDDNPKAPVKTADLPKIDLILVSHGAFDHSKDAPKIALRDGSKVICGGENYDGARPCNFDWVKSLRQECVEANVTFCFIETGTVFIKDGKRYHLPSKQLQSRMACKSGMNYQGRPIHFDLVDDWGYPIPQEDLYVPHFRANCETCGSKLICNGCSDCGKCL